MDQPMQLPSASSATVRSAFAANFCARVQDLIYPANIDVGRVAPGTGRSRVALT